MRKTVCIFLTLLFSLELYSGDIKYFPENVFNQFEYEWYSEVLDLLDPVNVQETECNVIRFSCIESMTRSYVIKLSWTDDDGTLNVFTESLPYENERKISFQKSIAISKNDIEALLNVLSDCNFYDQPSTEKTNGRDGNYWIIEAKTDNGYKIVSRWTPKSGFIYEIGNKLIDMSGERDRLVLKPKVIIPKKGR
ncbi:MAG: hypothetical protein J6Y16_04000 [Treponema sp.]|nr:hypothetical protein [Treponema sp.]